MVFLKDTTLGQDNSFLVRKPLAAAGIISRPRNVDLKLGGKKKKKKKKKTPFRVIKNW